MYNYRLFSSRHFCPRVYASFANGFVHENALANAGISLNSDLAVDRNIYPVVARRVGEMHRVMKTELDGGGVADNNVFRTTRAWLKMVPTQLADPRNNQRMKKEMPSKNAIDKELTELEQVLARETPAVVFCHGDLSPANVIFDPVRRSAVFAAPEYAGANYQAFELSQHFLSMAGADLDRVGREEYVPAKEFQMRWLHAYLAGYRNVPEHKVIILAMPNFKFSD